MAIGKTRQIVLIVIALILWSCNDKPAEPLPVESVFKVIPESGSTITRFEFNAAETFLTANDEHPILIRYDWQNDGIWDQDYTSSPLIKHRYLKPGTYRVRMEARNMSDIRDTSFATIVVAQGYSPPVVHLSIQPDSSNIYTQFSFDASKTYDDEDSSNLLTFRWDFDGDGNWDTGFDHNPVSLHQYDASGKFNAGVEVKDPTNRSSVLRKMVTVDLLNDSIKATFTADGGFSTVVDVFHFNASGSRFLGRDDKKLTYSWDILCDGLWEAVNLTSPLYNLVIKTEGIVRVKLRVTDDRGLYKDTIKKIEVFPENSPPNAVIVAGNRLGNLKSNYYFHSYGTSDRETSILDLKYQWDVNEDGLMEPEFDNLREINCHFATLGKHLVRLKVTDSHNDSSTATDTVHVYNGSHETGVMVDKRQFITEYYSTVKIGNLWWTQENMKVEIKPGPGGKPPALVRMNYAGDTTLTKRYGGLYDYNNVLYPICPKGWRLPTKAEFQEMVNLEAPNGFAPLLLGGSSEMHILMGGYIDLTKKSVGLKSVTNIWLADRNPLYAWYIDIIKGEDRPVIVSSTYGYSVRCVKSD